MNFETISDEKLYGMCRQFGEAARVWRHGPPGPKRASGEQKFAGLLPEVQRRGLHEKKGFESIFHFAKVLAGMSEEQVRRVLNLEKKFEKMPTLKSMLVNGEVSVNKLAKVASIATVENEEVLANQVVLLSARALETLARDEKSACLSGRQVHVNTQLKQNSENTSFGDDLGLDADVKQELFELKRRGIDINTFIREALETRKRDRDAERVARCLQRAESWNTVCHRGRKRSYERGTWR